MRSRKVDGPEVRRVREAMGLTAEGFVALLLQDRAYKKTGKTVTPSMIRKVETGVRQPGPALFAAIKRALKADNEALLLPDEPERGVA